ncbi:hypothetical protein FEE95_10650 [Maribacter algarum]|uniref:Lipoprotein n=1 Tax=Maribacter algarum (ex Zhang et al. 2020) TaxID=2578118 RepID=A0A5S3PQD6_9FLAO|nr:hypothetical protein [Maribacter algarum]TMM56946.1 hypothetical protein FEE95_10650 [Maribacter algarum]
MKTYTTFCAILLLVFFSCSKSDNGPGDGDKNEDTSIDADYVTLLSKDGLIKPQLLNANAEVITLNPAESALTEKPIPDYSYVDRSYFLQYHKDGNCGGQVTKHDFKSDTTTDIPVFTDLNDCNLSATALAKYDDSLFISYVVTNLGSFDYLVRVIDLNSSDFSYTDVTLGQKPVDLTIANNRLFILTLDELITDENSLSVMDMSSNELIHEMDLGYSVRRIFTDVQDNVIVSYDELHTTLNSATMAFEYTQYDGVTSPNFANSKSSNFDLSGRLFYPMDPGSNSAYPLVPAIYDFSKKLVVLYAFENFLTEAKRNFEYEIETTTAVGYDEKNGLMLIGYKKMNGAVKEGGLLRIKLKPEPAFVDNIDLDGVPVELIMN